MEYKLSDNVIANIVQLVQLAMMTGTDISDHFRMISLSPSELNEGKLDLSKEYAKAHDNRIQKLVKEAQELSEKAQKEQEKAPGFLN